MANYTLNMKGRGKFSGTLGGLDAVEDPKELEDELRRDKLL